MQGGFLLEGEKMKQYLLLAILLWSVPVLSQELVLEEIPLEEPKEEIKTAVLPIQQEEISPKNDGTLDALYSQLDAQNRTIKELTERFEQVEHRLKLSEEKLERVNQDIAFRLSELETKQSTPPVMIDKSSDKERYDYAYTLLKNQDYKQAEKEFLAFIKDFEKSDLIPNAIYWLGETYYAQGMFEQAVGQFADVFAKHPKSNKAPDALLKMGLSMVSLKKKDEACTAFIALPNEYPKASEDLKKRAKEEADKNKCS